MQNSKYTYLSSLIDDMVIFFIKYVHAYIQTYINTIPFNHSFINILKDVYVDER
jgi:hypothetical protein